MKERLLTGLVLACALTNGLIWYGVFFEQPHNLRVAVLDIGQGDAIFIESPTGNQVLIDGGRSRAVLRELGRQMPFYDRSIDVVMESHPDADHIGGLTPVLDQYRVGIFVESGIESETGIDDALDADVEKEHAERIIARRGMVLDLGGGAILTILFPDRDMTGAETNEASIIARLTYGDSSFLFTGDSPKEIEDYLVLLDGTRLQSTVLKVGHHGSKNSTSLEFANAVHPEFAAISVGKNNSYGHPTKEALDNLAAVGATVDTTEEEGTIVYESDGRTVQKK